MKCRVAWRELLRLYIWPLIWCTYILIVHIIRYRKINRYVFWSYYSMKRGLHKSPINVGIQCTIVTLWRTAIMNPWKNANNGHEYRIHTYPGGQVSGKYSYSCPRTSIPGLDVFGPATGNPGMPPPNCRTLQVFSTWNISKRHVIFDESHLLLNECLRLWFGI